MYSVQVKELRAYLLGLASEDSAAAIEQRYFTDRAYFLYVQAVETKLIESYLSGKLGGEELPHFESRYLAVPQLMARVAEVTSARKVRSAISFRVALACVASIIAISTLYFYSKGDRSGPKELRSAHQVLAVLALSPGEFKGDGSTTPSVAPPLGGKVVLKLEIPGQDRGTTFAVEVSRLTAEGDWQTVFPAVTATASAGPDRKAVLEVPLDSSSLSRGEYRVSVRGGQPRLNEHYRFRAAP